MEQTIVEFRLASVPYFHHEEDAEGPIEERVGFKKHQFETQHRGIWSYMIEAFAAHCYTLEPVVKKIKREFPEEKLACMPKGEIYIALADAGVRCLASDQNYYLCLPDICLNEINGFRRNDANHVASLNWYAYCAAKESILEWVEWEAANGMKAVAVRQARTVIAEYEWQNIKKVLSLSHLFDYPRPSNDRLGYLSKCGVNEVPLVLS